MNDKQFDDFLRLQLQSSSSYLDDGDFSARVFARLPAQKRLHPWLEKLIVLAPVTLITLLVARQFSWHKLIQPVYGWVLTLDVYSLVMVAISMAVGLLIAPILLIFKPKLLF